MGVLKGLGAALVLLVGAGAIYLFSFLPRERPAPRFVAPATPQALERGQYLVQHVLLCNDCHSERDWTLYGAPAKPPLGAGRACMDKHSPALGISFGTGGFPGRLCIRNITPDVDTGIGAWTDGEILRAMREGVGRQGQALFPIMPWFMLRTLSDEDAGAVIAYLKSQQPIVSPRPDKILDFPLNIIVRFYPKPLTGPVASPPRADTVRYGEYLTKVARCEFCHTARVRGQLEPLPDRRFAGGVPFVMGTKTIYSKNLTPHPDGLGKWTREAFIARFRADRTPHPVTPEENTEMDWVGFAGMTDEDLGAIWDFLRTVPPREDRRLVRAD